ncbi:MAG: SIS domain-containing protein [Propioniciclava sp.]
MTPNPRPGVLMAAEMAEQPDRWRDLLSQGAEPIEAAVALAEELQPELLLFLARGSSDHAAQYGQYLAHSLVGIPVALGTPASTTVYGARLRYPRTLAVAVSQSGESPDLLASVQAAQEAGVKVIGITNSETSTLAGLADIHLPLCAGVERAVAATKTYTAELLALYLLIARLAGRPSDALAAEVGVAAEVAEELLSGPIPVDEGVQQGLVTADRVLVIGRGYSMATAKEAALKLMETSAIAASGWSASDATHGPLGQVIAGTPVLAFATDPLARPSVTTFVEAAWKLGAETAVITLTQPVATELLPLLEILPMQRLAHQVALARGCDPDRPDGLAKVTRTH